MVCFSSSFLTHFSFAVFQYASENPLTRVFTWGMACYGALGVPEHLRPKQRRKAPLQSMHRPARCGFAETARVRDVACGYGFTLFALDGKESHIMGTGINKDGQIGMKLHILPRYNVPDSHPSRIPRSPKRTSFGDANPTTRRHTSRP